MKMTKFLFSILGLPLSLVAPPEDKAQEHGESDKEHSEEKRSGARRGQLFDEVTAPTCLIRADLDVHCRVNDPHCKSECKPKQNFLVLPDHIDLPMPTWWRPSSRIDTISVLARPNTGRGSKRVRGL